MKIIWADHIKVFLNLNLKLKNLRKMNLIRIDSLMKLIIIICRNGQNNGRPFIMFHNV